MTSKQIRLFVVAVAALVLPSSVQAYSYASYGTVYGETYAYYDPGGKIYGYSYTSSWGYEWQVGVEAWADGLQVAEFSSAPYYAEVDFGFFPSRTGSIDVRGYHYYKDGYWEYDGDSLYAVDVPVLGSVSISGPVTVFDGGSGSFSLTTYGESPLQFAWDFSYPSPPPPVGNDPSVSFTDPTNSWTSTDAHWFADPDNACTEGDSAYSISGSVLFGNAGWQRASTQLIVQLTTPGGETYPPAIGGTATLQQRSDGVWVVTENNYYRYNPIVRIYLQPASQFFDKINTHENVHFDQFMNGFLSDTYDPNAFYDSIKGFTASTSEALSSMVNAELAAYRSQEAAVVNGARSRAEREAYAVSDAISPLYAYQNCGRY